MAVSLAELGIDSSSDQCIDAHSGNTFWNTLISFQSRISSGQSPSSVILILRLIFVLLPDGHFLPMTGETAFKSGASATITGNMLTTVACATIRSDRKMLSDMGRNVTPEYWKEVEES